MNTPNAKSQATDAASSRQVACTDRLRKAYDAAVKANADTFVFEGNVYVVGYAKYLLEYLDERLK